MKTIKAIGGLAGWIRLAPILAVFVIPGCATAPPSELVSARAAYARAAASPTGKAAPVELHKARVALEKAEEAFVASAKSEAARDYAYVAERKAETAEAAGSTALADGEKQAALAAYEKKQAQLLEGAKSDLGKTQVQLAESGRELNAERGARAEADTKAAESEQKAVMANEALAKLAAKEEQRGMVITLSGSVLFTTNQATLLPAAQARLNDVAEALMAVKERSVVVEGHTDSRGSRDTNLALSQRRADAVRSYLVSRGYPSEKIEARGIGRDRPVAENTTAEGRANNRRVEIVVQRPSHSSLP